MNANLVRETMKPTCTDGVARNIPIAQLVGEVCDGASPPLRDHMLAQLVGQVYETLAPVVRVRLLEQLLRQVGVFSLFDLANGIFAKIRLRNGLQALQVRLEDAGEVQGRDVSALVEHLQRAGIEAFDGLTQVLATSNCVSGSAAAALLVSVLLQCVRNSRAMEKQRCS